MFYAKTRRQFWHGSPVLFVGLACLIVSFSGWNLANVSENRAFEREFVNRADSQPFVLENGIAGYWEKLYAVRALFDSSNKGVSREEFESFSNSLLSDHPAILNISWAPRVKREDRAAYEFEAARDGLSDYHIRSVAPDGTLPVSQERDEYFPKFYSTEARTSPVYGLDLIAFGASARTVEHIRDKNLLSTSPPVMLHIGQGDRLGFWAGLPVYARGLPHETVEDRRRNLLGIIQCVFQIGVMVDSTFSMAKSPVRLYLFAPEAAPDDRPVYFRSRFTSDPINAMSQAELTRGLHKSFLVKFGDVQWTLVVIPESAGNIFSGHERSWIILICGLLLSAGMTSFIWIMRRNALGIVAANARFAQQNVRFDAALQNMAQGLMMFDPAGKLIISNLRMAELFHVPWEKWEAAALGATVPQLMQLTYNGTNVAREQHDQIVAELNRILANGKIGTIILDRTDGQTLAASCTPMTDGGFVITFEDITERRHDDILIAHMAHHDALTDLPNRAHFYEKMNELLIRAPKSGSFAVLSLDLDRFKRVNDTLGHPVGDRLLQAVATRLRGCVRDTDIIARLGGDEFAIAQAPLSKPADAVLLATRLIDAVSAPYQIDGHNIIVGTSVGIAMNDGSNSDQLMKNADQALYRAKADGGNVYRFFGAEMESRNRKPRALGIAS
jgi:diguanylate cyclase (GGDEF)-like protein